MLKINGRKVKGRSFAYEGCHKIYICESKADELMMVGYGYEIYPLENIEQIYDNSCGLKFIENAKLDRTYVSQFEDATFEWED